jgi:hypothetical protein
MYRHGGIMQKNLMRSIIIGIGITAVFISFQNCSQVRTSFSAIAQPSNEALVCGAFDSGGASHYGIVGNIFVASQATDPGAAVLYPIVGEPVKTSSGELVNIYLSTINVPTRAFDTGFVNKNGEPLVDSNGNVLIEYFGLKLDFKLKLPENLPAGYYQFGLDSDDGSELKVANSSGAFESLISNDGVHATKSKCSTRALYFDHNTKIPAELYYYQGPRVEIALRFFWKKVDSSSGLSEVCGTLGTADGSANSNYWKIVEENAFELPDSVIDYCSH